MASGSTDPANESRNTAPGEARTDRTTSSLSRRRVVTSAAWAVPAIAVAATVPAAAASAPLCVYWVGHTSTPIATTPTSATIRFDFYGDASAAIAAEETLRVLSVSGVGFDGIDGNTVFPQDVPITAGSLTSSGALELNVTRSSATDESGEVRVLVQLISRTGEPCGAASFQPFNYVFPGPTGSVIAECGSGNTATFDAQLSSAPAGAIATMLFTHTGDGGLSTTTPTGWVLGPFTASTRSYTATVPAGGTVTGTFNAAFTGMNGNDSATVTAQLSLSSGSITGKTTAEVQKSIQGQTWSCSVLQ